jgi:hypothetical protein
MKALSKEMAALGLSPGSPVILRDENPRFDFEGV